jgi:hypothetical protein
MPNACCTSPQCQNRRPARAAQTRVRADRFADSWPRAGGAPPRVTEGPSAPRFVVDATIVSSGDARRRTAKVLPSKRDSGVLRTTEAGARNGAPDFNTSVPRACDACPSGRRGDAETVLTSRSPLRPRPLARVRMVRAQRRIDRPALRVARVGSSASSTVSQFALTVSMQCRRQRDENVRLSRRIPDSLDLGPRQRVARRSIRSGHVRRRHDGRRLGLGGGIWRNRMRTMMARREHGSIRRSPSLATSLAKMPTTRRGA